MTKEQAINYLKSSGFSDEQITSVTEALSEERKRGWIPATERLPEETGFYLCTLPMYHEEPMVDVCLFDKATGGFFMSSGIEYYVVAWMPLPKPYEKGAEE